MFCFKYIFCLTQDISNSFISTTVEAYFINRHTTFRNEWSFNFSKHQKFLKSIKKIAEKSDSI